MELTTVEIPRTSAREQAAEYRRAAKHTRDPERRREFEQIAQAYAKAAKDDVALISLSSTIAAGGLITRTLVVAKGTDHESRSHYALPKLAVIRTDASWAYSGGVTRDGRVIFSDSVARRMDYRTGVIDVDAGFELPGDHSVHHTAERVWEHTVGWRAMVPIVPPKHQPRVGSSMSSYFTLFEVDDWAWHEAPARVNADPALLQHVGGDIYAVLAVWDLTPLEQLVLSGRRPS